VLGLQKEEGLPSLSLQLCQQRKPHQELTIAIGVIGTDTKPEPSSLLPPPPLHDKRLN